MSPLGWWMLGFGSFQLVSIWFLFFNVWYKHHGGPCSKHIFSDSYKWTLANFGVLTCLIGYICLKLGAIKERPLYMAMFITFISLLTLALSELLIERTVKWTRFSPLSYLSSTLMTWLFLL